MVKNFIYFNVIFLPLHFMLFLVNIKAIATTATVNDWLLYANRFLLYTIFFAQLPNLIYLLKNFKKRNVFFDFMISFLIICIVYATNTMLFGYLYF